MFYRILGIKLAGNALMCLHQGEDLLCRYPLVPLAMCMLRQYRECPDTADMQSACTCEGLRWIPRGLNAGCAKARRSSKSCWLSGTSTSHSCRVTCPSAQMQYVAHRHWLPARQARTYKICCICPVCELSWVFSELFLLQGSAHAGMQSTLIECTVGLGLAGVRWTSVILSLRHHASMHCRYSLCHGDTMHCG